MNPDYEPKMLYIGEGMNASVAVSEDQDGIRYFHVSGKTEAATYPIDMRLQRMLGHLSALLNPKPRSVLVVGFGAGVTAGTFVTYPEIKRIVICEIEPLIPQMVSGYFSEENYNVVKDPRVEIVYDDARRFILTSKEKFDIITSDPIHPWVKGAATLYTREYFELVKRHLKPGGVVTQWVPLYESTIEVVKSEMATFFAVFPDGIVWINDRERRRRRGAVRPGRSRADQCRRGGGTIQSHRERARRQVRARCRLRIGDRFAVKLCRARSRSRGVAKGRRHQHGSRPAPAIPGRNGSQRGRPVPDIF